MKHVLLAECCQGLYAIACMLLLCVCVWFTIGLEGHVPANYMAVASKP
jgi:hypothetical protein